MLGDLATENRKSIHTYEMCWSQNFLVNSLIPSKNAPVVVMPNWLLLLLDQMPGGAVKLLLLLLLRRTPCRYIQQGGHCPAGTNCHFKHDPDINAVHDGLPGSLGQQQDLSDTDHFPVWNIANQHRAS